MCSRCEAIEDWNIDCARVANLFMCCGWTTQEKRLTAVGSPEYSPIIFTLFHIIMVDKTDRFRN